jgi:hypothetical protein
MLNSPYKLRHGLRSQCYFPVHTCNCNALSISEGHNLSASDKGLGFLLLQYQICPLLGGLSIILHQLFLLEGHTVLVYLVPVTFLIRTYVHNAVTLRYTRDESFMDHQFSQFSLFLFSCIPL